MAANYTITDQRPVTDSSSGAFVPAMEITFTTKPHGTVGRVRVPMAQYGPAEVDDVVNKAAATIESVNDL